MFTTGQILFSAIINITSPQNEKDEYDFNAFNVNLCRSYRKSLDHGHYWCGTYTYLPAIPTPNRANKAYGERNHAFMATASGSNLPFSRVTPHWSQMTSIHQYVRIHQDLQTLSLSNQHDNNTLFIDTAVHVIIYDFMAYTSQHLGYFRSSDETKIEMLRLFLRLDLESIVCPLFHSTGIYRMFKTIIEYSGPCRDQFRDVSLLNLLNELNNVSIHFLSLSIIQMTVI